MELFIKNYNWEYKTTRDSKKLRKMLGISTPTRIAILDHNNNILTEFSNDEIFIDSTIANIRKIVN